MYKRVYTGVEQKRNFRPNGDPNPKNFNDHSVYQLPVWTGGLSYNCPLRQGASVAGVLQAARRLQHQGQARLPPLQRAARIASVATATPAALRSNRHCQHRLTHSQLHMHATYAVHVAQQRRVCVCACVCVCVFAGSIYFFRYARTDLALARPWY
jgi:hypothetical protein